LALDPIARTKFEDDGGRSDEVILESITTGDAFRSGLQPRASRASRKRGLRWGSGSILLV